jgi:uncharacterized iron-regulated membrane protein
LIELSGRPNEIGGGKYAQAMNHLKPKRGNFMAGQKKPPPAGDWGDYFVAAALVVLLALLTTGFFLWIFHDDFKPMAQPTNPALTPRAPEFKP